MLDKYSLEYTNNCLKRECTKKQDKIYKLQEEVKKLKKIIEKMKKEKVK